MTIHLLYKPSDDTTVDIGWVWLPDEENPELCGWIDMPLMQCLFTLTEDAYFETHYEMLLPAIHRIIVDLQRLHDKGIVHRDIKLENIGCVISDERCMPRLIDFGMSLHVDDKVQHYLSGTICYVPPEMTNWRHQVPTFAELCAADVWCLMYTILVMMTMNMPFREGTLAGGTNPYQKYEELRKTYTENGDSATDLINLLALTGHEFMLDFFVAGLDPNPSTRPSLAYLIALLEALLLVRRNQSVNK